MAAGLDLGLEEAHSAICRHGRGRDGFSVLAEVSQEDGGGVLTRMYVQGFRGFQDGGGPPNNTDCHTLVMDQDTGMDLLAFRGVSILILMQLTHMDILHRHTRPIGKGVN